MEMYCSVTQLVCIAQCVCAGRSEAQSEPEFMSFCVTLLKMFALSPAGGRRRVLTFLHCAVVLGFMITSFSLQSVAIVICWGDFKAVAFIVGLTCGCGAIVVNYVLFIYNREQIFHVIQVLKAEYVAEVSPSHLPIVRSSERQVMRSAILKIFFGGAMTLIGTGAPLVNKHLGGQQAANLTKYQYMMKYMMFMTYTPLDIRESPQFEINYFALVVLTIFVVGPDVVIDSLYYGLLSHLTAQFKVLIEVLRDVASEEDLVVCIRKHQKLLR